MAKVTTWSKLHCCMPKYRKSAEGAWIIVPRPPIAPSHNVRVKRKIQEVGQNVKRLLHWIGIGWVIRGVPPAVRVPRSAWDAIPKRKPPRVKIVSRKQQPSLRPIAMVDCSPQTSHSRLPDIKVMSTAEMLQQMGAQIEQWDDRPD